MIEDIIRFLLEGEDWDEDWKDYIFPDSERSSGVLVPKDLEWWRYRHSSRWTYLPDSNWRIVTEEQGGRLAIHQFVSLSQWKYPAEVMTQILLPLIEEARVYVSGHSKCTTKERNERLQNVPPGRVA